MCVSIQSIEYNTPGINVVFKVNIIRKTFEDYIPPPFIHLCLGYITHTHTHTHTQKPIVTKLIAPT